MKKRPSHHFIQAFAASLPGMESRLRESARESAQAATWLVGLSTGVVALLAAKEGLIGSVSGPARRWIIALNLLTVALGVLQRLLYWVAEQRHVVQFVGLQGYLIGITTSQEAASPPLLNDSWNVEQIVVNLQEHFNRDYSFLSRHQCSVETAREAYAHVYQLEESFTREDLASFEAAAAAYAGRDEGEAAPSASIEQIRSEGRAIARISRAATWCLGFTGASFVISLAVLAFETL